MQSHRTAERVGEPAASTEPYTCPSEAMEAGSAALQSADVGALPGIAARIRATPVAGHGKAYFLAQMADALDARAAEEPASLLPAGETFGPEDRELAALRRDAERQLEEATDALETLTREAGRELAGVRTWLSGGNFAPISRSLGGPAGSSVSRAAETFLFAVVRAADLADRAARREATRAARKPPECRHVAPGPHAPGEPDPDGSTLVYRGHYGAPGIGWHGECSVCGGDFAVVGSAVHDPADGAHVLEPEDVR